MSGMAIRSNRCGPTFEDKRRRLIVKLIFCVYALLILEGILRKWMFPQFSKALFFIRDPFVVWIYILFLGDKLKISRSPILFAGILLGIGCLIILIWHAILTDTIPLYLALYGWRNYFFYLPLAFVIQRCVQIKEVESLCRYTLMMAIPMAVLTVVQVSSPAFSPINAGLSDDPEESFVDRSSLLAGGLVRPAGTFTSNLGLTAFVASAFAINIVAWLVPRSCRFIPRVWLIASTLATVVCLAVSGSRGAMLWSGSVVVFGILGLLVTNRSQGVRAFCIMAAVVGLGIISMPLAFPEPTAAFVSRWTEANQTEVENYGKGGIFSRAFDEIIRFRILIDGSPMFGYGLGSAGNAAWHLGNRENIIPFATDEEIGAAETDWGRNILELGPILGCVFIAYRLVFVSHLCLVALKATGSSDNPLPWLLFSFVSLQLAYGQITAHGTINGYIWIYIGLCLSATQRASRKARRPGSRKQDLNGTELVLECA